MADILNTQEFELPHSLEAEKAVVGCVLQDKNALAVAVEILSPEDFYFDANREIYDVAIELFNENVPVDVVTVSDRLTRRDKLDAVGGIPYLAAVSTSISTTEHITHYANIVMEKSVLRRLSDAAGKINDMAVEQKDETDSVLVRAEQMIYEIAEGKGKNTIVPVSEIAMETFNEMVESSQKKGGLTGLDTGFRDLNLKCGGFHGGEFILIAGRPAMGKSSFAVNIAENVAIGQKKPVAIFNLEMSKTSLLKRIICSQALIDSNKILTGEFDGKDWQSIGEKLDRIAMAPLYIDDSSTVTISDIRAKCQRLKQTKGLSLIIIDYLQLMKSPGKSESRQNEVASISRDIKILAKELDVPIIALSQLSRGVESRQDKRPVLADIRESGSIEQDTDMVMFIYRDEYYNPDTEDKNVAELIIAKHRQGEVGKIKLGWQGKYTKFNTIDYNKKEEQ